MSKVRLGFVGVGGMGQCAHLRNYLTLRDCEVPAIAEIRPKLGQEVGRRYGIAKVYTDHKEMLDKEQLDGIVAIQQFSVHVHLIPDLLRKKVPVITEKPLAATLESGRQLAAAVQQAGVPLYLAYHKRSDPASLYARRQMDAWRTSGEMGKLRYVRVAMPPGDWAAQGFSTLVGSDEKYSVASTPSGDKRYGVFVNYYIHQVNLMRFLLGEDYRVTYADPAGVLMAVLSDSNVPGALEMATFQSSVEWQEEAFIAFERGWIRLELPAPMVIDRPGRVTVYADPKGGTPTYTTPVLPPIHAMRQQAMHFLAAIRGEKTVLCTAADGLKDLQAAQDYLDLVRKTEKQYNLGNGD